MGASPPALPAAVAGGVAVTTIGGAAAWARAQAATRNEAATSPRQRDSAGGRVDCLLNSEFLNSDLRSLMASGLAWLSAAAALACATRWPCRCAYSRSRKWA